jgi:Flp pilus assembly protein CpaB
MKRTLLALFLAIAITAILYYIVEATKPEPIIIEVDPTTEEAEIVEPSRVLLDITEGNRAMALNLSALNSVAGFVLPGTYIDVYGVKVEGGGDDDAPVSPEDIEIQLLFTDMRVISIDTIPYTEEVVEQVARPGAVMVLDVTPKQIEDIIFYQTEGWEFKYVLVPEDEE